ncbi:DUF3159 domain-containing protein [Demequina sp. NBRC 110056]|uniref:DUF3159 domain-containing protein n=1 Tax=Demequina sp. NBRC 110056 TaxID=1570345 RepID=UPI00117E5AA3|nr:DUF3159 domain-containing protein [Demequina sp. NBRC 110056]
MPQVQRSAPQGDASPDDAPRGEASPDDAPRGEASPDDARQGDASPDDASPDDASPGEGAATGARTGMRSLAQSEQFSVADAVGGWRGFAETAAPGVVFVVAFVLWGGFRVPVIASVATVLVLVVVRLIQRSSVQQALSGVLGVGIGAIWAWRAGDPGEYFVPGLWLNAAYLAGFLVSMVVRWPLVGVVVGLLKGSGMSWRTDRRAMRAMQLGTAVFAAMYALRLVVQVPLYLADQVAVLGTVKLVMGVPLFALTLWTVWLLVRNAVPGSAPQDQPQPTR